MKKFIIILIVLLAISGIIYYEEAVNFFSSDCDSVEHDLIHPDIEACDMITSPYTLTGEARGYWYFEADFPVTLEDADGNVILQHYATAQSDWMTEEFVPFETTLEFTAPSTPTGKLILHRDNPSGLPENDDQIVIPVTF